MRIRGLRANASCRSHAELDESPDLDAGNPAGTRPSNTASSARNSRNLHILGGCCGTDHRHVEAICDRCLAPVAAHA